MDTLLFLLKDAVLLGLPVILAITLHESAHGFVALKCGDTTAYDRGRITLNPFKHIDLFGTILLPGFLIIVHAPFVFGYAKPVPVNFEALRNPRWDTLKVAIAGPLTNVLLAYLSALAFYIVPFFPDFLFQDFKTFLSTSLQINCILAVFNMLPILPLDGGRILGSLLPPPLGKSFLRLERYGMIILLVLISFPFLTSSLLGFPIPLLSWILFPFLNGLLDIIRILSGIPIAFL